MRSDDVWPTSMVDYRDLGSAEEGLGAPRRIRDLSDRGSPVHA
jgi:hypothetical protein